MTTTYHRKDLIMAEIDLNAARLPWDQITPELWVIVRDDVKASITDKTDGETVGSFVAHVKVSRFTWNDREFVTFDGADQFVDRVLQLSAPGYLRELTAEQTERVTAKAPAEDTLPEPWYLDSDGVWICDHLGLRLEVFADSTWRVLRIRRDDGTRFPFTGGKEDTIADAASTATRWAADWRRDHPVDVDTRPPSLEETTESANDLVEDPDEHEGLSMVFPVRMRTTDFGTRGLYVLRGPVSVVAVEIPLLPGVTPRTDHLEIVVRVDGVEVYRLDDWRGGVVSAARALRRLAARWSA